MAGCAWPERDSPAVKRGSLQNGSPVVSSCSAVEAPSCPPVIYRKAGHLIFTIFLFLHSVQMSLEKVTGSLSRHRILPTTLLCTADLTVVCSADRSETMSLTMSSPSVGKGHCSPIVGGSATRSPPATLALLALFFPPLHLLFRLLPLF